MLPIAVAAGGTALIPVADEESVWLGFEAEGDVPSALRVRIGGVDSDPVAGRRVTDSFEEMPQNYVVVPPQHWLAGATVQDTCGAPVRAACRLTSSSGGHRVSVPRRLLA